jgi:hypothetical protein
LRKSGLDRLEEVKQTEGRKEQKNVILFLSENKQTKKRKEISTKRVSFKCKKKSDFFPK